MLKPLLQISGWITARLPEPLLCAFAMALGRAMLIVSRRRRRLVYANLHHAFPGNDHAWHRRAARESSQRLFETALISLASPYLSDRRLRTIVQISPAVLDCFREHRTGDRALIVATPHMAYWESLTWLSLFLPDALPEFGVIFRPLDNPTADAWVKKTRERHGMRLLSRKEGLAEAFRILRRKGVVGVLFDQNAGLQGALTTLFGRVCSTTELPGLLAEKTGAKIVAYYPRRLGFWRIRFEVADIFHDNTAAGVTIGLNRWLESALTSDDTVCSSWLWSHNRWRHQDIPDKRFRLESKRDLLSADIAARQLPALPRQTRFWIRLPNWLGDVVMALPLLKALRASRPDAEITLIAKAAFLPLLDSAGVADHLVPLPHRGPGYFLHFWKRRRLHPDVYLLLTHSFRGDLEARLSGCSQRFGLVKPGRSRPLLTHRYVVPADFDEGSQHQLQRWENLFHHFGLRLPIDLQPLKNIRSPQTSVSLNSTFGFIAGSENNPEKRWPVPHWRSLLGCLLERDPRCQVLLFGTTADRAITDAIAESFDPGRVRNLAGRTDLPAYMNALLSCDALVTNDTGGMHLANALGVPLLALFGPTNPVRTGPVFNGPFRILQPPGCPPTGGAPLATLHAQAVLNALDELRAESRTAARQD